jgi:hypothetical protein
MAFTMSGTITGEAVTGLTSPTYTLTADQAADAFARQSIVSALGGTQTGVVAHSIGYPFTVTVRRPKSLRSIGRPNLAGVITSIGRNTFTRLVRKGVTPALNQTVQIAIDRREWEIPAGAETYDAASVKALVSFANGFDKANTQGVADTLSNALI